MLDLTEVKKQRVFWLRRANACIVLMWLGALPLAAHFCVIVLWSEEQNTVAEFAMFMKLMIGASIWTVLIFCYSQYCIHRAFGTFNEHRSEHGAS